MDHSALAAYVAGLVEGLSRKEEMSLMKIGALAEALATFSKGVTKVTLGEFLAALKGGRELLSQRPPRHRGSRARAKKSTSE